MDEEAEQGIIINQAIVNTAIRFGIAYTSAQAVILVISRIANIDPFGTMRLWMLVFIPVFIFFGLKYLSRFEVASRLTFGSAFRTGSMTSFLGAACSSMLIYLYSILSGPSLLLAHKKEMQDMLKLSEKQLTDMLGKQNMIRMAEEIDRISPSALAFDDFFQKIIFGIIASFILAFFFRKREPQSN